MEGVDLNGERQTRSGRKISGAGQKRKRGEDSDPTSKAPKMTKEDVPVSEQLSMMQDFLGKKIDEGLKATNDNVNQLAARIIATEDSLSEHRS